MNFALSRRKQGFESPWARQRNQAVTLRRALRVQYLANTLAWS